MQALSIINQALSIINLSANCFFPSPLSNHLRKQMLSRRLNQSLDFEMINNWHALTMQS